MVTTRVSPARHAASASRSPGALAVGPGQAVIDVDALGCHPKRGEPFSLDGEACSSVETRA